VAITARTLTEGESYDHVGMIASLPGSLEATADAVKRAGGEALCLQADILEEQSMVKAAQQTLDHFGSVELLFNNAVYQGTGNLEPLLQVTRKQIDAIYQGNIFTPLALVKTLLPGMLEQHRGTIINMLSYAAFTNPPAPADKGGWGFAYPSSKAAFGRMAGSLAVEHPDSGLRCFNLEPGAVITEVMKAAGIADLVEQYRPCSAATIAAVVRWLAINDPLPEWQGEDVLRGPAIAKQLGLLKAPSLLENYDE
jgi:NAD(P)-dependent dehydrogenase (short-subunit alcohol dehydrogenase family)